MFQVDQHKAARVVCHCRNPKKEYHCQEQITYQLAIETQYWWVSYKHVRYEPIGRLMSAILV